jgi:glutathione S-transferase
MSEIILHHYPESPFSEKVRLALGYKGLAWRSVITPNMMPKPDLLPLTGGYRRAPVMQIGADVWCDSQACVREIERRHPAPTLYPPGSEGLADALLFWADRPLFQAAVGVIFGAIGGSVSQAFVEDRQKLMGRTFSMDEMKAGTPIARDQLRAHLDFLEQRLARGSRFLFGDAPSAADLEAYHNVWFVRNIPPTADLVTPFARVREWFERVRAIGHGRPTPMDPKEALEVARAAKPETRAELDPGDPNGRKPGDRVAVFPDDYGRDPVAGELVRSSAQEIAIRRHDPVVGEIVVHFPRAGFVVVPG